MSPPVESLAAAAPSTSHAWHALPPEEVIALLGSDAARGLAPAEAARRLGRVGANRVADTPERPLWRLALDQFRSLVVLLLLGATGLAGLLDERPQALAILAALLLNAAIGFGTEWRARTSLTRLRALVVPHALVRRGGGVLGILAADLVPGDLVLLVRDPAGPDVMRRPPRDPRQALMGWRAGGRILGEGALLAAGVLSAYLWAVLAEGPGPRATTIAFLGLVLNHPLQALHCRSDRVGWWRLPPNPLIWVSLLALVTVQWWAISWAPLAGLLGTVPLGPGDWLATAGAVLWPVALLEGAKVWGRGASVGPARPSDGGPGEGKTPWNR